MSRLIVHNILSASDDESICFRIFRLSVRVQSLPERAAGRSFRQRSGKDCDWWQSCWTGRGEGGWCAQLLTEKRSTKTTATTHVSLGPHFWCKMQLSTFSHRSISYLIVGKQCWLYRRSMQHLAVTWQLGVRAKPSAAVCMTLVRPCGTHSTCGAA